mmetsp:Transcript_27837/g.60480  ORF Transcript_27837/g.60480 Transcript_27837/m.60480 type:complete len:239 (+) Transcript_27837:536-1252(+)
MCLLIILCCFIASRALCGAGGRCCVQGTAGLVLAALHLSPIALQLLDHPAATLVSTQLGQFAWIRTESLCDDGTIRKPSHRQGSPDDIAGQLVHRQPTSTSREDHQQVVQLASNQVTQHALNHKVAKRVLAQFGCSRYKFRSQNVCLIDRSMAEEPFQNATLKLMLGSLECMPAKAFDDNFELAYWHDFHILLQHVIPVRRGRHLQDLSLEALDQPGTILNRSTIEFESCLKKTRTCW